MSMISKSFFKNLDRLQWVYILLGLNTLLGTVYTFFFKKVQNQNNYFIFKASFSHLQQGLSLYEYYPQEHVDLFLYSPTFAAFFGLFAIWPNLVGEILWNFLGYFVFLYGFVSLPVNDKVRWSAFWVFVLSFSNSAMHFQSNILIVGFLLCQWSLLERGRPWAAAFCLVATFYIKIYAIFSAILILLYWSNRSLVLRFILGFILSMAAFFVLPLCFTSWDQLMFQYQEWYKLMMNKSSTNYGFSFLRILQLTIGEGFSKLGVQFGAACTYILIFWLCRKSSFQQRVYAFAALCYFYVLFNHQAEGPTFVIPMVAFGLHQAHVPSQRLRWFMIALALFFVNGIYSDLVPRWFKLDVANFYAFKIWPFLLIAPVAIMTMLSFSQRFEIELK